jgi:hypothetical protein
MTHFLAVIKKLGFIPPSKPGQAQRALWVVRQQALGLPKKHHSRVEELAFANQAKPKTEFVWVTGCRIIHTLSADGFLNGADNFRLIQVCYAKALGRSIFPAMGSVHALEQKPLVPLPGHEACGRTMAQVGTTIGLDHGTGHLALMSPPENQRLDTDKG